MTLSYTFKGAAVATGYCVAKLYKLARDKKIDVRKDGKKSLITAASLQNYIESLPRTEFSASAHMKDLVQRRWTAPNPT